MFFQLAVLRVFSQLEVLVKHSPIARVVRNGSQIVTHDTITFVFFS